MRNFKRKHATFLTLMILILVLVFVVCTRNGTSKDLPKSEIFEIAVGEPEIIRDGDDFRLQYTLIIDNKSDQVIESLTVSAKTDSLLEPYLVAGNTIVPLGEYDLVTKEEAVGTADKAYGVECSFALLLKAESDLSAEGVTHQDILEAEHNITINLEWANGSESHVYPMK